MSSEQNPSLESMIKAFQRTKEQLEQVSRLGDVIDDRLRTIIRRLVADQLEEIAKKVMERAEQKEIILDEAIRGGASRGPLDRSETWIYAKRHGLYCDFGAYSSGGETLRRRAVSEESGYVMLPSNIFAETIRELETSILRGDMDEQLHSPTDELIRAKMIQEADRHKSEWIDQLSKLPRRLVPSKASRFTIVR